MYLPMSRHEAVHIQQEHAPRLEQRELLQQQFQQVEQVLQSTKIDLLLPTKGALLLFRGARVSFLSRWPCLPRARAQFHRNSVSEPPATAPSTTTFCWILLPIQQRHHIAAHDDVGDSWPRCTRWRAASGSAWPLGCARAAGACLISFATTIFCPC